MPPGALFRFVQGGRVPCRKAPREFEAWRGRLAKLGHAEVFPILEGGAWRNPMLIHKISHILHKVARSGESGGKEANGILISIC